MSSPTLVEIIKTEMVKFQTPADFVKNMEAALEDYIKQTFGTEADAILEKRLVEITNKLIELRNSL